MNPARTSAPDADSVSATPVALEVFGFPASVGIPVPILNLPIPRALPAITVTSATPALHRSAMTSHRELPFELTIQWGFREFGAGVGMTF